MSGYPLPLSRTKMREGREYPSQVLGQSTPTPNSTRHGQDMPRAVRRRNFLFFLNFLVEIEGNFLPVTGNVKKYIDTFLSFSFSVCSASELPTIAGVTMVRGFTWIPSEAHRLQSLIVRQCVHVIPNTLITLHSGPQVLGGALHATTVHQVHLS